MVREMSGMWYPTSDYSLFPKPLSEDSSSENSKIMSFLGYIIARGLYDDRLLDFPINSLFWDLLLNRVLKI